jgi:hypothetical protein
LALSAMNVKVAFLGACHSAARDDLHQWGGVAEALLKAGLCAVVGMQFTIKDNSAIAFVRAFYERLFNGETIDEAIHAGRLTLAVAMNDMRGFATPVLYLRDADGAVLPTIKPQSQGTISHDAPLPSIAQLAAQLKTLVDRPVIAMDPGRQQFGDTVNTGGGDFVKGDKTVVNTGGGAFVVGNVTVGRDFVGRDKVTNDAQNTGGDSGDDDRASAADQALIARLYDVLSGYRFGESDLQDVCFRLGIDWDGLGGDEKKAKARSLVTECHRSERLQELRALVKKLRPNVDV